MTAATIAKAVRFLEPFRDTTKTVLVQTVVAIGCIHFGEIKILRTYVFCMATTTNIRVRKLPKDFRIGARQRDRKFDATTAAR